MIRLLQKTVKTITNETSNLPVLKPGCDRVTWSKILARAGFTWQSWKGQGIGRKSQTDSCIARSSSGNLFNIFMKKSLNEITCKFSNLLIKPLICLFTFLCSRRSCSGMTWESSGETFQPKCFVSLACCFGRQDNGEL
jgi:hypothetical protein